MGWRSGDELLGRAWEQIRDFIPEEERVELFADLIDLFEDYDMDDYVSIEEFPEGQAAYAWRLLKLRSFIVDKKWGVKELPYSRLLRSK